MCGKNINEEKEMRKQIKKYSFKNKWQIRKREIKRDKESEEVKRNVANNKPLKKKYKWK